MTTAPAPRALRPILLASTFVVAAAGLGYELVAGAASSYLLGDSVTQFSLVIGLFMTAMGMGAWASRHVPVAETGFVHAQIALALVDGLSAPLLFWAFAVSDAYQAVLVGVCLITGVLVGLEIPLVIRILEHAGGMRHTLSDVLALDYIGALVAALCFPLILAPELGLIGAGLLMGLLNIAVAWVGIATFMDRIGGLGIAAATGASLILGGAFVQTQTMTEAIEARLHGDDIVLAQQSAYQRIVLTRAGERWRFFLNGGLQFDTADEHRYHEALVHPAMLTAARRTNVLVLGGGDGMAVREVLRHRDVARITLVDLDPEVTDLFRDHPVLSTLNAGALGDPRVTVVNADAWDYLRTSTQLFDVVIADLPDPRTLSLSKLYSRAFYRDLSQHLAAGGVIVTQATSPLFARQAFWTIEATLAATPDPANPDTRLSTRPYHATVPSFGPWGFVLAGGAMRPWPTAGLPNGLRFLTPTVLASMPDFPADMARINSAPNALLTHTLHQAYLRGWQAWYQ